MDEEIWKAIPGHEGKYEASNHGRIRSLRFINKVANKLRDVPLVLSGGVAYGYIQVQLCKDGKNTSSLVHRLILKTFLGECPLGMVGSHKDGNRKNNCIDNLLWETAKENEFRKKAHGTLRLGTLKLNEDQVRAIRELSVKGLSYPQIAKQFNVDRTAVGMIVRRERWPHVK